SKAPLSFPTRRYSDLGAGKTIGLPTADVLGLATALSAVGIRAEMGGSALSRVLINMSQAVEMQDERLREFARTAGMSAREYADTDRKSTRLNSSDVKI